MQKIKNSKRILRLPVYRSAAVLVLVVLICAALVTQRARERSLLSTLLAQASFTTSESLRNPAIFTHDGTEDLASLHQAASLLAEIHAKIAAAKIYLNKNPQQTALRYTEYLNRIATKLNDVSDSRGLAQESIAQYENSLTWLKSTNAGQRASAFQEMETNRRAARNASELAYQECVLLSRLLEQYPQMQAISDTSLGPNLLIEASSLSAFKIALEAEIQNRNALRKQFNQAAN
jgi:hypothetical protein